MRFKNKIVHGDCLKVLPKIPSESIDLIFTDPPWGIPDEVKAYRNTNKVKYGDRRESLGEWDKKDDFLGFTFSWVDECIRVLRKGGIFCSYFDRNKISFLSSYLEENNMKVRTFFAYCIRDPLPRIYKNWNNAWMEIGIWRKKGGKLHFNKDLKSQKNYMLQAHGNIQYVGGERFHPTQKPLSPAKLHIKYWSSKNDIVLDPFLGSGTTAVASKQLNREFIGIEINEEYANRAKRIVRNTSRRKMIMDVMKE